MNDQFTAALFESFFDELSQIEKRAMLQRVSTPEMSKEAGLAPLGRVGRSIGRGFKMLANTSPKQSAGRLRKAWEGGIRARAKHWGAPVQGPLQPGASSLGRGSADPNTLSLGQRLAGGMTGVLRSSTGKALAATGAGLGVGGLAALSRR